MSVYRSVRFGDWQRLARQKERHVAAHEILRRDLTFLPITQHAGDRDRLLARSLQCARRFSFRQEADDGVEDDHDQD